MALFLTLPLVAQEDLMGLLDEMEEKTHDYSYAAFKTVRIVNGHSIEIPAPGVLQMLISHRFGRVNTGIYDLFGLDQANMRMGFEYGLSPHLCVGIGRSNIGKTYDSFLKIKLLRQQTGKRNIPITLAGVSSIQASMLKWADPDRENYFTSRLSYSHQLLIARKFSDRFSFQLMPTMVHRNLVATTAEDNDVFAVGAGARYKLSGSVTLNAEYYYLLPSYTADTYENSLSIGVDIETGGHVFQLLFTNSLGMTENQYVANTDGRWENGDIHFGFNLARVFTVSDQHNKAPKGESEKAW
jgi:opacity protein-like surface antigen